MENIIIPKSFVEETLLSLLSLHEQVITNSGGEHGIRDEGGLYQSVYKILRYRIKYANDPFSLAAFVYQEIARKHHLLMATKELLMFMQN